MKKDKHIFKVIQHRAQKQFLSKEMQKFITEKYPSIKNDDMVEILEYRSLELSNTWKP